MDLERLSAEVVFKEIGGPPSQAELGLVPKDQQALFTEVRRNNNLLTWLVQRMVILNNVVADQDKQLGPIRLVGKAILWIIGAASGIGALYMWIKNQGGPHKP